MGKPWEVSMKLEVQKDSSGVFGLAFQGRNKMVLKRCVKGSASEKAGGKAYVGRRVTHANGKVNARCRDIMNFTGNKLTLRWAYPAGYPLEVLRHGRWDPCAVRTLDERRYILTGADSEGVYEKIVPFDVADSMIRVGDPGKSYKKGQDVVVLKDSKLCKGSVAAVDAKGYKVQGRDWVLRVTTEASVKEMKPATSRNAVAFVDPMTKVEVRFEPSGTKEDGVFCYLNGVKQGCGLVTQIRYQARLEGDQLVVGTDESASVTLPFGDNAITSDLRLLLNECGVRHNIIEVDLLLQTIYPLSNEASRAKLISTESADRKRILDIAIRAARYLKVVQKRLRRNLHGNAAATGLRVHEAAPLVVSGVVDGSPASQAGIQIGDLITKVRTPNGVWSVYDRRQLATALGPKGAVFAGTTVTFEISRHATTIAKVCEAFRSGTPSLPALSTARSPALPARFELPNIEGTFQVDVTCAASVSYRNKLLINLMPLSEVHPKLDPEFAADVISDPKVCRDLAIECAAKTVEGFSEDGTKEFNTDEVESVHTEMMKRIGVSTPISAGKIESQFTDAVSFHNTQTLAFAPVELLLRDLLIENIFAAEDELNRTSPVASAR